MSDTDTQDPPQDPAADTTTETTTQEPDHKAEAEKWKALARKHEGQAKQNATAAQKLQEIEDAKKSAEQKAADKAAELEQRATTAELTTLRYDVALDKAPDGMSIAQVRKLAKRLSGSTREELEADADELFADFAPADDEKPDDTSRRRPKERLKAGAVPGAGPKKDPGPGLPRLMQAYGEK